VNRQGREVPERGLAAAEVIQADPDPGVGQFGQHAGRALGVDQQRRLGDLEDQPVGGNAGLTQRLDHPLRAAAVLADLAQTGVRISIDDFGCGQTSLGYLSALPIHELKIDKSFVTDMTDNQAHAVIVRSIVDLGHNLALRVVAEGVETEAVLTGLRTAGCDVAQGYLFARAMPPEQLLEWLASDDRQRRTARVAPGQARRQTVTG